MASQNRIGFLKWMFSPAGVPQTRAEVVVGDRFQNRSASRSVWVVERISSGGVSNQPLVSLSREGHPDLKKVVSMAALQDGQDFSPAA